MPTIEDLWQTQPFPAKKRLNCPNMTQAVDLTSKHYIASLFKVSQNINQAFVQKSAY
mgnify:CR=1 FL=1